MNTKQGSKGSIGALLIFLAASFVPGLFGSLFRPEAWYESLVKPALNPPGWIFGPVWTLLYGVMGVSAWLVWRQRRHAPINGALLLFGIQLFFNGLWSFLFFGLKHPGLAFVEILVLWAAIASMLVSFWRKSRPAGLLVTPYLSWVSFAVYLNFALWRLNVNP